MRSAAAGPSIRARLRSSSGSIAAGRPGSAGAGCGVVRRSRRLHSRQRLRYFSNAAAGFVSSQPSQTLVAGSEGALGACGGWRGAPVAGGEPLLDELVELVLERLVDELLELGAV